MKQITLSEAMPGMVLARSILNNKGQVLLVAGITLTIDFIRKLHLLNLETLFILDANYADIKVPEYLSMETQQRALSILTATMERVSKDKTFPIDPVTRVASDIVEELISHSDVTIHLTGIAIYDDCTLAHSLNCSIYTALLARCCGFSIPQIKTITCGALLHDIGKIEIDKVVLNKPGRLTPEEFEIMKHHPALGFNILAKKRLEISSLVAHMAWQHHEKIDGTGYPRGLKGNEILSYARLLSITDVFEAITGNRPYRKAMKPEDAYNIIRAGLGTSFDQEYGELFLAKIALYPPGSQVLLSTGERGIVISVPPASPHRPVVRLIVHPDGSPYSPPQNMNLDEYPEITISSLD